MEGRGGGSVPYLPGVVLSVLVVLVRVFNAVGECLPLGRIQSVGLLVSGEAGYQTHTRPLGRMQSVG